MKRILLVWPYYYPDPGAASARGHAFFNTLSTLHEVWVITRNNFKCPYEKDTNKIVRLRLEISKNPITFFPSLLKFCITARRIKPEVIIVSYPSLAYSLFALSYSLIYGTDVYWDVRDLPLAMEYISRKCNEIMFGLLLSRSKHIFVTTALQKEKLDILSDNKEDKISIVSNGVDLKRLQYSNDKSRKVDIAFLGSMNPERDPHNLYLLLKELLNEDKKIKVLFIGYDHKNKYWGEFRKMLTEEFGERKISFVDELEYIDAFKLLLNVKIGIVSIIDNRMLDYQLPVKVFEYMAAGVVVAALVPNQQREIRRFFEFYYPGIIEQSPLDLSGKIISLLSNENELQIIRERNLDNVKNFDRNVIMEKVLKRI